MAKGTAKVTPPKNNDILMISMYIAIGILLILTLIFIYVIIQNRQLNSIQNMKNNQNEKFVEQAKLEIVYVYSDSCGYCKKFDPVFEAATQEFISHMKTDQYDVHVMKIESKQVSGKYTEYIDGFPTVLIFIDGNYRSQIVGYRDKEEFLAFLSTSI